VRSPNIVLLLSYCIVIAGADNQNKAGQVIVANANNQNANEQAVNSCAVAGLGEKSGYIFLGCKGFIK